MNKIILWLILVSILVVGTSYFLLRQPATKITPPEAQKIEQEQESGPFFNIESLRKRKFEGGKIKVGNVLIKNDKFTSYLISYPSDGLKITGYANIPKGDGPFPTIVLLHGWFPQGQYQTGFGTKREADFFAQNGFSTVAPDYRGYANSDKAEDGPSPLRSGYVIDVLNLLASLKSLPQVNQDRVFLWGHSMGGGIALRTLVVNSSVKDNPNIKAAVLFAPRSADLVDEYKALIDSGEEDRQVAEAFREKYGSPEENPIIYQRMSPINYFDSITLPISIHHSQADTHNLISWSEKLKSALEKKGKRVEFFTYPGDQHTFLGKNWEEAVKRSLNFFNKY